MKRFFLLLVLLLIVVGLIIYKQNPPWAAKYHDRWFAKKENQQELILYGNVDIRQVDLGFGVLGRVEAMDFQEGDVVSSGTLMAKLDKQPYTDKVNQALAHIESVKASLTNSTLLLKRREVLFGTGGISEQDIDDAKAAKRVNEANLKEAEASLGVAQTNLKYTEIYAPSDGTILTRIREPGTMVRETDPIYTLSLLSPVWVRAYVSEPQLGLIYPGMSAEVYTDTKGHHYQGHIGFISPVAEFTPKTVETTQLRTDLVYRLRVIVDNPDHGLRQGMPVTVKLPLNLDSAESRLKS